ncbi:hypothetical protein, partial [Streptomyces silvisoli]
SLCYFFKGTSSEMDGVSTYLALTFGTLLSSQGTEASFETVSPAPPGFPFGFSSLSDLFGPDSRWRDSPSGFRFPAFPTVPDSISVSGPRFRACWRPLLYRDSRQGNYTLFGVAMSR